MNSQPPRSGSSSTDLGSTLLRTAIRGWATYQLGWCDAHLWAYAEEYGLDVLVSEDFQHDRVYGTVRVVNPFAEGS